MKRNFKKSIILFCLICVCSLTGCFYSFENSGDGKFAFGVSSSEKNAFCICCNWDGGDTSFVIPDEFMGYKVTALGGYTGRGYPCPFSVQIDLDKVYPGDGTYGEQADIDGEDPDDEYDILGFSVHLGANVVKIEHVKGKAYIVRHTEKESGEF